MRVYCQLRLLILHSLSHQYSGTGLHHGDIPPWIFRLSCHPDLVHSNQDSKSQRDFRHSILFEYARALGSFNLGAFWAWAI